MTDAELSKKLQDKVAIITGGTGGIGEATARLFAKHGARAVVIADVHVQKGLDLAASIGPNCNYIRCDVTDEEQVKSLVDSTVQMHGRLDIMFSNAGKFSSSMKNVLEFDFSHYEKLMAVNVRGMAACVKHAARAMVDGGWSGSVVCTGSIVANTGTEMFTDYTISKHAVLGLVRCASMQLGKRHGIRVNCVSPGPVSTSFMGSAFTADEEAKFKELMETFVKSGGQEMSPEQVANAVLFLASEDSQFVTGHNLVLDAGFNAH